LFQWKALALLLHNCPSEGLWHFGMGMMSRAIQRRTSGFTLVELMIVVAIIGLLAAIAIPSFSRYVRKARASEAVGHLNKEWSGSLTYYESDHTVAFGQVLTKQFPGPSAAWANASECGCLVGAACPGTNSVWNADAIWQALSFALPDPHHYMPGYSGSGAGTAATFTAYAKGDMNCNNTLAEFSREGRISSLGDVTGSRIPTIVNELE
jgi:prepilin-type N-terminal cleavage/methylation domain-containing protein